jgi:hypothetical protein
MAFNDLAANQMVAYNQASSGGFNELKSKSQHITNDD